MFTLQPPYPQPDLEMVVKAKEFLHLPKIQTVIFSLWLVFLKQN
jgi:hypothetical protein